MMIEDEELRNLYKISGEERLQKLEIGLLQLENDPEDETTLEMLRREAHSLKGDSRSVGVENVETLIHTLEEILLRIKRKQTVFTPLLSLRLYQGLDAIGLMVQEAVTGQPSGLDTAGLLNDLMEAVLDSKQPQQEAAQEAQEEQKLELVPQGSVDKGNQSTTPTPIAEINDNALQIAPTFIEDEELRNLYKTSSEERLEKLEAGLLYLEKHPNDETILEKLRREAHSLKGDSRIVGIESVEALSHTVSEILGSIKHKQTALTPLLSDRPRGTSVADRLYQGLDAIGLLVQEAVTGQPSGVDTAEVLNQLMAVVLESKQPQQGNAPQAAPSFIEDEELRDIYKIASVERLHKLEAGLLQLEKHPDDETILEMLRREVHSLKADSRSVGVDSVETLTHTLEEIVLRIKRQEVLLTPLLSHYLYQGLQAIGLLVEEAVTGQASGVDTAGILDQLITVVLESKQPQPEASPKQDNALQLAPSFIEDEELRDIYKIASVERLQKLEAGLLQLEKYPDDETILEMLRREVHSIKGDSRSVGVDTVETLTHTLEEILGSIKNKQTALTPLLSDRLYQGLQAIGLLVEEAVTGQPSGVDTAGILDQLMAVVLESKQPQPLASPEPGNAPQLAPSFIEDEELRDIYKIATVERLQKLEVGLLQLEKYPDDETILEMLLREAHSLKGDSRSVGVDTVETLTHTLVEILGSIKHKQTALTPLLSDRLYQGLDAIGLLVREAITGQPNGVDTAGILDQLMAAVVEPTIQESLPVPAIDPSLPATIPLKAATQDLPSVGEPYRIDTIRVQTRELDALMTQAEELTVTKISIAHATAEIEEMATLWEEWKAFYSRGQYRNSSSLGRNPYQERLEKIINSLRTSAQENSTRLNTIAGELRDKIRTLRLLPLSTVFQLFPRMVRDLARQQSKEVELIIEGGETTADKRILEEIKDSLMHMVRNAIDHGIETPAERERLGKPPVATIWLRGYQTGTNIVIEVADDGRGLDIEKIKQTAVKRGLYHPEELALMTPSQIHALIFAPGFSTRSFITEISGRGIGLDVVRTNVELLKGNIQIESTLGQGCTFRIQLSTTLTTINAMLLEVQGIVHAVPLEFVQTTLLVYPHQISITEGRETIAFDNQEVPLANLSDLLKLSNSPAYASTASFEQQKSNLRPCLLLKVGEEQAGFFVDRLLDTQEVVLKPQSQLLKRVRNVTGATILPTGEVCMILNPADLLKSLQKQTTSVASIKPKETVQRKPVILLVEDSLPVRTQEKRLLEGAGYEVVIAVDGLDGYNKLKTRDFDAVLSDVEMPNLDGLSLTAKIRQHQEYSELPIILVTTLAADEDKRRGAEAGANAYVIKGKFNQDVLLEILGRLV